MLTLYLWKVFARPVELGNEIHCCDGMVVVTECSLVRGHGAVEFAHGFSEGSELKPDLFINHIQTLCGRVDDGGGSTASRDGTRTRAARARWSTIRARSRAWTIVDSHVCIEYERSNLRFLTDTIKNDVISLISSERVWVLDEMMIMMIMMMMLMTVI